MTCRVVPFAPGCRPTDEDAHPGLGSSDCAALVTADDDGGNRAYLLLDVADLPPSATLRATVEGADLAVEARRPRPRVEVRPNVDLARLDLGFDAGCLRRVRVDVTVEDEGAVVARDHAFLDVCDVRRLGSLYRRVVDRLLAPDVARQAAAAGVADPGVAYHPWYPVLEIGMDKAALYTAALVGDIVHKERHLSDPAWLLRVGVYLELLTCLGIVEAVRPGVGDLLDPDERAAFEASPAYDEIRRRIDPAAWREVWDLRRIPFARRGLPRTGPVSMRSLLDKKRATLRFLHVHHEDLKHAIELAGPNHHNAQETWHRVFRDAERAVLRRTAATFPELSFLPPTVRELVLWQRRGIAEQQGLYATAAVQYRASMNAVAAWAKERGLMDYTGHECIPVAASLLHAHLFEPARVGLLQAADGYGDALDVAEVRAAPGPPTTEEVEAMLADVPVLGLASPEELRALAATARPLLLAPGERFVIQGQEGTSLFVVAEGEVEVVLRRGADDVVVEAMPRGAVIGEMALLTGERRAATVRAVDGAVVYEIGRQQYEPLVRAHPEWLDDLAALMAERLERRHATLAARAAEARRSDLRARIRRRFFNAPPGA